jgi:hypothetical protein
MPYVVNTKRAWSHSTIQSAVTVLEERSRYRSPKFRLNAHQKEHTKSCTDQLLDGGYVRKIEKAVRDQALRVYFVRMMAQGLLEDGLAKGVSD